MPGWMQVVNDWNPITYLIEAIRALMVTATTGGHRAGAAGHRRRRAVLQAGTLWAFRRLTN